MLNVVTVLYLVTLANVFVCCSRYEKVDD